MTETGDGEALRQKQGGLCINSEKSKKLLSGYKPEAETESGILVQSQSLQCEFDCAVL